MPSDTIAILGAGGFAGRWLHREIVARGLPVWPATPGDQIDVRDRAALEALLAAVQPRALINLAAVASPTAAKRAPQSAWDVNFHGTMNVGEAILARSPHTRLVFVGSAEEYGSAFNSAPLPLGETAALAPTGTYGASKAAADLLIGQLVHEGLHAARLRPFNHTGPGQAPIYVVAAFARQVARIAAGRQAPVIEVGNLSAIRDFLDVRDVVRAYVDVALADAAQVEGRIFNLASGRGVRIGDILQSLIDRGGIAPEIVTAPSEARPGETPSVIGDASALANAIGWTSAIPFEQTLDDVLADWRDRIRTEAA